MFHVVMAQYFVEDVRLLGTPEANDDNSSCVMFGLTQKEFDFVFGQMMKYKIEHDVLENQK
jgi:hypothetical protein